VPVSDIATTVMIVPLRLYCNHARHSLCPGTLNPNIFFADEKVLALELSIDKAQVTTWLLNGE
jgi:hypothetical protein